MNELPANFQPLHINWLSDASYLARLSSEQLGRDENQLPKFECASSDADLSRSLDQSSSSLQCGLESLKGSLKSGQYYTMKGSFYATIMHPYLQSVLLTPTSNPFLSGPISGHQNACFLASARSLKNCVLWPSTLLCWSRKPAISLQLNSSKDASLQRIIKVNLTIRARLLHYFLPSEPLLHVDEEGRRRWLPNS